MKTQTQVRTYTYTSYQVPSVTLDIFQDLDVLVTSLNIDLAKSMGGKAKGPIIESNQTLIKKLKDDLFYLLSQRLIQTISFVFHEDYNSTLGGHPMTYEARYEFRPADSRTAKRVQNLHVPLRLPRAVATSNFKVIVKWSDNFLNHFTEGERQMIVQKLNFKWTSGPRLTVELLGHKQMTSDYDAGFFAAPIIRFSATTSPLSPQESVLIEKRLPDFVVSPDSTESHPTANLLKLYREHWDEVEVLMDSSSLLMLGFIHFVGSISFEDLHNNLGFDSQMTVQGIQKLVQAGFIGTKQGTLSVTESGARLLREIGLSSTP